MKSESIRALVRSYGQLQFRSGRSKLRRWLSSRMLESHPIIELLPSLRMKFDLRHRGSKKYLPPELLFWFHEEWEPALQWAIRNLVPLGGEVVDCGANTGIFGFLACYYRGTRIDLIEPHPRLAALLRENIALNGLERQAYCREAAAADFDGQVELVEGGADSTHHVAADCQPRATLSDRNRAKSDRLQVRTMRLAELWDGGHIQHADLVKIDCEGFDYQVLKGLAGYLSPEFVTMLYVEDNSDETSGLLKARGFVPFNSRNLWIDELRHQRFSECISTFFESGRHGCRKNALWCAKQSSVERFMSERLERTG